MKNIVTYFLIVVLNLLPGYVEAVDLASAVQSIESEWARIRYSVAKEQQEMEFSHLLATVETFQVEHPKQAELIIQKAIVVATNAENVAPLDALDAIHEARDLLLQAIKLNPNALQGAAYVTLGTLYYRVPAWPIAYGDDDKAQQLLENALAINANTIDANYFYADFLVAQGKQGQALKHFNRALNVPVRESQILADTRLQALAQEAIDELGAKEKGLFLAAAVTN